ncbi:hypothetical protein PRUPE_6G222000 [Prunus persica]|uniref:B-like cyclin n=1 Tax=Prunus persica TaxID=3760 RepID=A0A251NTZ1_PRUPE|nr:hypothetical protein PRUPE_6G222000 [Prunus persica]
MRDSSDTSSFSLSSLLCHEDQSCLNQLEFESNTCIDSDPCFVYVDEDEYVENLVRREARCFGSKGFVPFTDCSASDICWLKTARLDSIEWIFNDGKLWAIRLLSVACLSLAAKMEECKVPALSEFQVQDYNFESKVIQRMELLVLNTLEWKLGSITPFAYLHYFINKFCAESRPKGLFSGAIRLIVAMAKEIDLMDTRPSIIAAAAVLAASDGQLTRKMLELKMSVVSFLQSQENYEHIFSCYNHMQEMVERKDKTPPKFSISPSVLAIHSSSMDVLENSVGTKRRLTFSDSDHSCPTKKNHRP